MTLGRLLVAIPVLVGFSLATTPAGAQATASSESAVADAVELKNGGYLRGLIVEFDPATHVSLRMPDGQIRSVPVAEIESAERGGKPLSFTSAPPVAGVAAVPAAPVAAAKLAAPPPKHASSELERILTAIPGPRITLESSANRSAFLERRIGETDENAVAYHLVCKLPCSVELPVGDLVPYRVANLRLEPTDWFRVPKSNARVRVDLASDMWPIWTRAMLVGGFFFGATGGAFLGINELSGQKEWARDTGYVLLGVGGACFIASGLLALFSPHTSYTLESTP